MIRYHVKLTFPIQHQVETPMLLVPSGAGSVKVDEGEQ